MFYKDESGQIFHTYSSFARGGEQFLGIYRYLDVMPKGRNENGPHDALPDWARLHDTYGKAGWSSRPGAITRPPAPAARTTERRWRVRGVDRSRENAEALSRTTSRLVPAPSAVEAAAAKQKNDNNDNEKRNESLLISS